MTPHTTVTYFDGYAAARKTERQISIEALAEQIRSANAPEKSALPWLKLARFGNAKTTKGSLPHDRNVISVTGCEIDYDGQQVGLDAVIEALEKAGVLAITYTSPSHRPEAPRWRVLCPFSRDLNPALRAKMVDRLNGLLKGVAHRESWTLSQAFYFGSVNSNPHHRVEVIDGIPIDELDELDLIAIGPPRPKANGSAAPHSGDHAGPLNEQALLEDIRRGAAYHVPIAQLAGLWARRDVDRDFAKTRLRDAFFATPEAQRDGRWRARFNDVGRIVDDIYEKDKAADTGAQHESESWAEPYEEPWPVLDPAALIGLPGDVVAALEPHTEADHVAILIQYLVTVGNSIGRGPYYEVEADRHYLKLFAVLVGDTAKARKGTSYGRVRQIMEIADPTIVNRIHEGGLSSGEGIIWAVRDEIHKREKVGDGKKPSSNTST